MKRFIVRYKVKTGRAEENQDLIKKVFAELHQKAPAGSATLPSKGWTAFPLFISFPLRRREAKARLRSWRRSRLSRPDIRERCEELPVTTDLEGEPIGSYGF